MNKKTLYGLALAAVTLSAPAILAPTLAAQTLITGDLSGRVVDTSGAVVPNATLTLTNPADGSVKTTHSDNNGNFRFSLLRPGSYTVHEEGGGMTADISSIAINVGQGTPLTIVSRANSAGVTVDVNTNQPLLQSSDANISTTFSTAQIEALPIPGGDISNLPFSTPGVNLSNGQGYGNFTAFGLPGTSNVFTVNGGDLMDNYDNLANSGASNNTLGANELQEAAVVVNGYTGQYGRLAGAQVNFTTKSGTNQFHGNGLFYYNSSGFNANDWFIKNSQIGSGSPNAQPHAVSRQWGGSIGGPIIKDRLFFFFDDEGLRYALPGGGSTTFLPSTAFQNAILANIAAKQPAELPFYQNALKLYSGANGFGTARPSTSADGGCGDFTGTVVAGTTFGASNPCSVSFVPANNNLNTEQLYSVRVDYNINAKDQINGRYKHDFGVQATGTDPINAAFNANSTQPEWEGQLNETHIFNSNIVNSFTAASLYYGAVFGPPNFGAAIATFPTTFAFADGDGFANLGGSDNSYPSGRNLAQYQFIDDLSITHGRHSFKVGGNFRRYDLTLFSPLAGRTGLTTFNSNTDFYNGVISAAGASTTTQAFSQISAGHEAIYNLSAYAQDQIALTPKLNVTASLRFDRLGNPACRGGCYVRLNGPFETLSHNAATPYNQAILSGQNNAFNSVETGTFQPRFGFAYAPNGQEGNLVIRGGAGVFADLIVPAALNRFVTSAPNYVSFTLTPTTTSFTVAPGLATSGNASLAGSYKAFANGYAGGATLASLQTATGGLFSAPNYTASTTNNLRNPKFIEYNLEVQRSVGAHDAIDINYVGNFGIDILFFNPTPNAYAACFAKGTCPGGLGSLPTAPVDSRFTAVTSLTNFGHSNYNGIVTSYRHQGSHGVNAAVNYTYSHSLDNTSNGGYEPATYNGSTGSANVLSQIDPSSPDRLNYGNSDYDTKHNLSLNYSYNPQFTASNHLVREILTGYSLSGTLYAKSGAPYSVIRTGLAAGLTNSTSAGTFLGAFLGGPRAKCGNPNDICLTASQFATKAQQPLYGFGNLTRNSFRGPMYFDTDVQFAKITPIYKERARIKIGANFFNILNHPNFASPYNNLASSAFGQILGDIPPVSSPYGNFQGAGVSGRIIQVVGGVIF